jgi:hypothetical protein
LVATRATTRVASYGEGFCAGLLVKLTLPLTRWAPGAARTVPRQRRYNRRLRKV